MQVNRRDVLKGLAALPLVGIGVKPSFCGYSSFPPNSYPGYVDTPAGPRRLRVDGTGMITIREVRVKYGFVLPPPSKVVEFTDLHNPKLYPHA